VSRYDRALLESACWVALALVVLAVLAARFG
jgi:hypothetical protein